jgi:hypothetical protein
MTTNALQELSISAPHFNKGGATLGKMPSLAIINANTVKTHFEIFLF